MKLNDFKEWFSTFAAGIPVEGPNSAQWRKLQTVVDSVVEVPAPAEKKAPVEKTVKQ
jgi:hypothetical protein